MRCELFFCFLSAALLARASSEEAARKVLASKCWACHSQTAAGGLRLDSREAILRGGSSGAAITPGNAGSSRLIQAVRRASPAVKAMPPGAALTAEEVQTLERWVSEGAHWTEAGEHWSFLALRAVRTGESIDGHINDALRLKKLTPAARADRRTLIRRIYYDLIGLPPTEEEFSSAFDDARPDWLPQLVTKLLNSSHFGENWARHWLDVARYGEDDFSGTEVIPYANAWRYREWVVQALNGDMPYDRFLKAQIAGDLMKDDALLPATGFFGVGPWYYGIAQPAQTRADERNDRIDVVTRGMLGVTIACARCHDHKYDPFTAQDYYALAGVFASTAYKEYPLVSASEAAAWESRKKQVDAAEKSLNKFLDEHSARLSKVFAGQMASYMMAASDGGAAAGLHPKILERWKTYLAKPEDTHPFLKAWFASNRTLEEARAFERLLLEIVDEKKALDEKNRLIVEAANKQAPKVVRTIVLPNGYRSEEDFNPGAYIASESLQRDRFVAWNRIFGETAAPLKLDRKLTAELLETEHHAERDRLQAAFDALKKDLPPKYPFVMGSGEFEPHDIHLNLRGNPEAFGELVPRRFPLALSKGQAVPLNQGSGRLELADAVAYHPLAARVAVNRIWLTLFGQGLVRTPSNFGRVGDRPVLPELLEYLAARFIDRKYSTKELIREIVLTEAYARSSAGNAANEKSDGGNQYLWRQNRRRLEAEPLRDAMLAVAGELDRTVGGESKPLDPSFRRRTLYAKTGRFQQDQTLSLFDLPAASVTCEQRAVTNVPLQKLFFLNSEMVGSRATALARRIENADIDAGISSAYRLLFLRAPTESERKLGREFLSGSQETDLWRQYARVLLSSNEFAYVD